jgi:hypothetical protein
VTAAQHFSSDVAVASDAAGAERATPLRKKAATVAAGKQKEEIMRVISQAEQSRLSKAELSALLRQIATELTCLEEGSPELRNAHST